VGAEMPSRTADVQAMSALDHCDQPHGCMVTAQRLSGPR
jgi:hypothetical protein